MDSNRGHVLAKLNVVVQSHLVLSFRRLVGFYTTMWIHWRCCYRSLGLPFFPLQRSSMPRISFVFPTGIPRRGNAAPLPPYRIAGIVVAQMIRFVVMRALLYSQVMC